MRNVALILAMAVSAVTTANTNAAKQTEAGRAANAAPLHVSSSFQFVVRAPLERAAPLFGPQGERCWAGQRWDPQFLHPQPAQDVQGAVFTVQHGPYRSVWVNTVFDLKAGRMQYVALIPEMLVSTVDVRLTPASAETTRVDVTYARTALDAAANEDVKAMSVNDGQSGPDWERSIEKCLARTGAAKR